MPEAQVIHRPIKSFVLRQGRITGAQARAFDRHWARYGLDYAGRTRDFASAFGRTAPLVLEIGFGNGEQLVYAARGEPARDFLGVEVHRPGVGHLFMLAMTNNLANIRASTHDAVEVLGEQIATAALDEVLVLFPDPWHKKRHHKRRLIQPPFIELVASRLAPGGVLRLATDWEEYARQMLDVMRGNPRFTNLSPSGDWMPTPPRAPTRFEKRGARLGHGVWDLAFRRG